MSSQFLFESSPPSYAELNQEIEDLYQEIEELHGETELLTGIIAGGFAFFSRHLLQAIAEDKALSPQSCEALWRDAMGRILSTQEKFDCNLMDEILIALSKMQNSQDLVGYFEQLRGQDRG